VTKGELGPTLEFARLLAEKGKKMWVRCVVVPDLTDDIEHFRALKAFLIELGHVERVEILPFHKMGESKWKQLGYDYELTDTPPPSSALLAQVRDIFSGEAWAVL
jgi:pyruvate formate lyase activating enzyme